MKFVSVVKLLLMNPLVRHYGYACAAFLTKKGVDTHIAPDVLVRRSVLGNYASIERGSRVINSKIGSYSYLASDVSVGNAVIGNFCSIGTGVRIGLGIHPTSLMSTHPVFYSGAGQCGVVYVGESLVEEFRWTQIESDVWVGAGALIIAGVKIGVGAIVGAGSVVTKDIPPYSVVVGAPARVVRYRFDQDRIGALMKSEWWLRSDRWLRDNVRIFSRDGWSVADLERVINEPD